MLIQKVVQSCGQVLYKDTYVVMYFYITIGYVCTNIYISGSKPLICIYIVCIVFIYNQKIDKPQFR